MGAMPCQEDEEPSVDNPKKEDNRFGDGRNDKRSYANVLKGEAR